jgi:hypothetical protein
MNYILTVTDEETDEIVCEVEAKSLESLEEQLRKVENAVKMAEAIKRDEMQAEIERQMEELAETEQDRIAQDKGEMAWAELHSAFQDETGEWCV